LTVKALYDGGIELPIDDLIEIDVQAKIIGSNTTIYNFDIRWGEMKFVFDDGEPQWDPTTHTYLEGTGKPNWLVDNSTENNGTATEWYLEDGNNAVTVINHSNGAIDADFTYGMLSGADFVDLYAAGTTSDSNAFNVDSTIPNAVVGGFYASEDKAKAGALILANPTSNADYKPGCKISLPTAEGRDPEKNIEIIGNVYLAFSGTPDTGRGEVIPDFRKVGTITVTIMPNNDPDLNTPGDDIF
jgi:hypothetical protein